MGFNAFKLHLFPQNRCRSSLQRLSLVDTAIWDDMLSAISTWHATTTHGTQKTKQDRVLACSLATDMPILIPCHLRQELFLLSTISHALCLVGHALMCIFFGYSSLSHTVGTSLEDCAEAEDFELVGDCPSSCQSSEERK